MAQVSTRLRFASAASDLPSTPAAVEEVIAALRGQLAGDIDLLMVFATAHHDDGFARMGEQFAAALAPRVMLASSAEGVITLRRELQRGPALAALAASLPGARIEPFTFDQINWAATATEPDLLRQALQKGEAPIKAVVLVADSFSTPITQQLPAFAEALPGVPVVGGMASGARQPGGNRLLVNGRVMDKGAIGFTVAGDIDVTCTLSQGCRPIGRPLLITRSKRHVVLELGGRKALDAVTHTLHGLSDEDRTLVRDNGLLIGRVINEYKSRFGRGDFLIRNLMGYDEKTGYIAINDTSVRTGQTIQFHVRDQRTAREDFALLLEAQKIHGPAAGALLFTCNGRGLNLFNQPHEDAVMVADALGDAPLAGFFAAGEIGPVGNQNFLHGHTASLIVFRPA